jgi:two-component system response regulator
MDVDRASMTVLLVEDNDDDADLTALAFEAAQIPATLVRVGDGVEALDYLFCRDKYAGRARNALPAIVLLDLNLPRLGGIETLAAIRADEHVRHLPVVVLTSSDEERDRTGAYRQFANSYIRKPVDFEQFTNVVKELGVYWLVLNRPPPQPDAKR